MSRVAVLRGGACLERLKRFIVCSFLVLISQFARTVVAWRALVLAERRYAAFKVHEGHEEIAPLLLRTEGREEGSYDRNV